MKKGLHFSFSTSHIIILSFLAAILVGSVLLSLPVSAANGEAVPYIDALFTATTATCVTGLVTLSTATTWSVFGQAVILLLIQIGGLGVITVLAGLTSLLNHKMGLGDRILLQDAFNLNTLSGLAEFVKKVIFGTLLIEAIGALLYMTVFVPQLGARGVWVSVFNSVSAFCNAGIDIIGENSLCDYATSTRINFITCGLVVMGGLGYIVWWDLLRVCKDFRRKKGKAFCGMTLHSKIVLSTTAILIVSGAILFFIFEYHNPLTMKECSVWEKIEMSLFQSVTTRTAGFATVPQENLTNASSIISLLLMFIGGSPVGTAGGIKTVTVAVLIASAVSAIKNKNEVTLFHRAITKQTVGKATAVAGMSFLILFVSTVLLSVVTDASALDILYETVSATATVGLTRNLTPLLNDWGKLIIIVTMFLGRVGPISLAIAFRLRRENQNLVKNPIEEISVG